MATANSQKTQRMDKEKSGQEYGGFSVSTTDTSPTTSPHKSGEADEHARRQESPVPPTTQEPSSGSAIVATVKTRQEDDRYYMQHKRRGVALIFNHENFDNRPNDRRYGTEKDNASLHHTLKRLGFDVRAYQDLEYKEIIEVLTAVSEEDHTDNDCLLVAAMSHGLNGTIDARDRSYETSELWERFKGESCKSLIGKPKLFFIQACRGEGSDPGSRVACDSADLGRRSYVIPREADVLIMCSTSQGYVSWKNDDRGSWFIQELCKELDENAFNKDLLSLLTAVNGRVALYYESRHHDPKMSRKVEMPDIQSKLTRALYFLPPRS